MIEEKIRELEKAESTAKKIVEEAKKQAETILLRIPEEKEVLRSQMIEEATKEAEKIRLQALSLAAKKEEIFREDLELRIKNIKKEFSARKEELIRIVVERLKQWV